MTTKSILAASLPERWGVLQHLKNDLIYAVVRVAFLCMRLTPFAASRVFAILLGNLAALLDARDRRRAEGQLARAMPELSASECRRLARRMFVHLAVSAIEIIHTERFLDGPHAVTIPTTDKEVLEQALAEGRGVVLVTGHIGNWELCGQVIAKAGFPMTSIAKPTYDPRLTRFIHRLRTAHGHRILWRGDTNVVKEILRTFKENGILGILIDQDTRVQGIFVPFFSMPAHTPTAAASFALRARAPVLLAWSHRVGNTHQIHFERCPYTLTHDHDADVQVLTAALSLRLETAIRAHPEQWVWLHERWKKQPTSVDRASVALNNQEDSASIPQRSPVL